MILWFGKNGQKSIRMNVFSNKLDIIDMHWTTAMSRGTWREGEERSFLETKSVLFDLVLVSCRSVLAWSPVSPLQLDLLTSLRTRSNITPPPPPPT